MNAKASATPPNCARTPHKEVMNRLSMPSGRAVLTAYAKTPPTTAPMIAVSAERMIDCFKAVRKPALPKARTLPSVRWPSLTKAATITTRVGISRKTVV